MERIPDVFDVFGLGMYFYLCYYLSSVYHLYCHNIPHTTNQSHTLVFTPVYVTSFLLGTSYTAPSPKGGIALPGMVNKVEDKQYSWTPRLNKQNTKWREGRSPCERPRTYDKFYKKTPGNFQEPQTDSAVSLCSSENEEQRVLKEKDKKKRRGRKTSDANLSKDSRSSKTLTDQDIKHIERHLSMKRTIRKKTMRDLQQAFVKDPEDNDNLTNLLGQSEPNILDMLRDSQDSGNGSPVR